LIIKSLPHRLHPGMGGIGQHDFAGHVQFGQLLARRRDFIAAFPGPSLSPASVRCH
jgi:hypothetical protein